MIENSDKVEAKKLAEDMIQMLFQEIDSRGLRKNAAALPHTVLSNMLMYIIFYGNKHDPNDFQELYENLGAELDETLQKIDETIERVLGIGP